MAEIWLVITIGLSLGILGVMIALAKVNDDDDDDNIW